MFQFLSEFNTAPSPVIARLTSPQVTLEYMVGVFRSYDLYIILTLMGFQLRFCFQLLVSTCSASWFAFLVSFEHRGVCIRSLYRPCLEPHSGLLIPLILDPPLLKNDSGGLMLPLLPESSPDVLRISELVGPLVIISIVY
jgi:hypothetical protein